MLSSVSATRPGMTHVGFRRPENTNAPAIHFPLGDFDVAMHDHHKRAEVRIGTPVSRAWIRDQHSTVVDVGSLRSARLVRPETVAALAIPVKVPSRSDH